MNELNLPDLLDEEEQARLVQAIRRGRLSHRQLEKEMGRKLTVEEAFALTHIMVRPKYWPSPTIWPIGMSYDS